MSTNNRISNLVSTQLPFFVRNDHENFVKFLEAYYEYLEQDGKTVERAKRLKDYHDVDQAVDIFSEKLYEYFLKLIPANMIADKNIVLKHVKDFYTARGTEKSISFLMNILYGDGNTSFYYPKQDILRASDGKWFIEKSLKIENVLTDNVANSDLAAVKNFANTRITGLSSNATAIVEKVDSYFENGALVKELKISAQERDFVGGESIIAYYTVEGITRTLKANIISGIVSAVDIVAGGNNYIVGDQITVESNTGSGAVIKVDGVTAGNLTSVLVVDGGAGFQNNQFVLFTGTSGGGANANVTVTPDGTVHPASYNIVGSTISLVANVSLNSASYANLSNANVNTSIANAVTFWTYANTGPVQSVLLIDTGSGYATIPNLATQANTLIKQLGILGKMVIIDAGLGYANNETIHFVNVPGGSGVGAVANIFSVNANGSIESVRFTQMPGHIVGGSGYSMDFLPQTVIQSNTGNGANIAVTALLGYGDNLRATTDSIGSITSIKIFSGGTGYLTAPTLNLTSIGDGTAQVTAFIVTGVYTYPGRYLNDDGHLSSYNFLQDRDYYQNYSYVVRVKASIDKYRKAMKDLIHPTGMKLFGEYTYVDDQIVNEAGASTENVTKNTTFVLSTYSYSGANSVNVTINRTSHGLANGNTVYVEFDTGNIANAANGILRVVNVVNANSYIVRNNVLNTTAYSASGDVYVALYK